MATNTAITAYNRNSITTANGTTAPATYSINDRGTIAITATVTTEDGQKTIRLYIAPDHPDYPAARAAAEPETVATEAPAPAAVDAAPAEALAPVKTRKARKTAPRSVKFRGAILAPNTATIDGVAYPATYTFEEYEDGVKGFVCVLAYGAGIKICYNETIFAGSRAFRAVLAIAKAFDRDKWVELMKTAPAAPAAAEVEPETVEATAAPAVKTPVAKPWIGSTIDGNGWRIVFDEAAQRTRVIFDTPATEKQAAAVVAAGFYWSPTMQSYNKGLKCKAYRAAQELAKILATVA